MPPETVKLNNLRIAPRKVRLLASTLKGLSTQEAEAQLLLRPQRSSGALLKLLRSAVANAVHNKKADANRLFIKTILVNPGPMLKRFMPRAQGRAAPIHKKMSHVLLTLEESAAVVKRFVITPPPKKEKKKGSKIKSQKPKAVPEKQAEKKERVGFFRRLFRRKSV